MTLFSLASRQIWPQVLSVAHLKPRRIVLLHSNNEKESHAPARRLAALFTQSPGLAPADGVATECIPHDNFNAIEQRLDALLSAPDLDPSQAIVHFTGGNKLMAAAVFQRAIKRGVRAFYLERRNQVTWFEPDGDHIRTRTESVRMDSLDPLDPADLLACQFGDECITARGELLTLNSSGRNLGPRDLAAQLRGNHKTARELVDFRKWLDGASWDKSLRREGDNLEYASALAILASGVPRVRRGIEWQTQPGSIYTEGELDLVFHHGGRLWIVDCKDRIGSDAKIERLRTSLIQNGCQMGDFNSLLDSIQQDLQDRDLKILREDLMQVAEVGGQEAFVLAVRSSPPPRQALEFVAARQPRIEFVLRQDLVTRLPALLAGKRPS